MNSIPPEPCLCDLSAVVEQVLAHLERLERSKQPGAPPVYPRTGFSRLDDALCGGLQPGLHILKGGPGTGKTALALQIAASCGCPALFVTCEVSPADLLRRHICRTAVNEQGHPVITYEQLKRPALAVQRARVEEYLPAILPTMPQVIDATGCIVAPALVEAAACRVREKHAKIHGWETEDTPILVVVDSLHQWARYTDLPEYERLAVALSDLLSLAANTGAAVLALAEVTIAEGRTNLVTTYAAGQRGTGHAPQSIWHIALDPEDRTCGVNGRRQPLEVVKNRDGDLVKLVLRFDGKHQSFHELQGV